MNTTGIILSDEMLRLLQLNELSLLVELDRICRKNGIKYTLAGGTLLGAVRHKGFIPWDDDADVRFKRDQYEKFFEACKNDLDTEHFFLQDYRTDKNYRWGYAKLRLNNTEYVRKGQEHMKYRTGVSIDIFVTDNVPDSSIGKKYYFYKSYILRKILYSELGMVSEKSALMRLWYKFIYKVVPRDSCFRILNKMAEKSNVKETKGSRSYTWVEPNETWDRVFDNHFFEGYDELEFEGMMFSVVEDYHEYLKRGYGDYMKLPPLEKRVLSGPASKIELLPMTLEEIHNKYYAHNKN